MNAVIVKKDPKRNKSSTTTYLTRSMPILTHRYLKQLAFEYEMTMEEMVNYLLRLGIHTLKGIDIDQEGNVNPNV